MIMGRRWIRAEVTFGIDTKHPMQPFLFTLRPQGSPAFIKIPVTPEELSEKNPQPQTLSLRKFVRALFDIDSTRGGSDGAEGEVAHALPGSSSGQRQSEHRLPPSENRPAQRPQGGQALADRTPGPEGDRKRWVTPADVANAFSVHLDTVYRALATGSIPGQKCGKQWRIPAYVVEPDDPRSLTQGRAPVGTTA